MAGALIRWGKFGHGHAHTGRIACDDRGCNLTGASTCQGSPATTKSYGFPVVQWQRVCLQMQEAWETRVPSLDQEDPPEKEMAIHSRILAWEIPWTGYGPWGHKGLDKTEHTHIHKHTHEKVQEMWSRFPLRASQRCQPWQHLDFWLLTVLW